MLAGVSGLQLGKRWYACVRNAVAIDVGASQHRALDLAVGVGGDGRDVEEFRRRESHFGLDTVHPYRHRRDEVELAPFFLTAAVDVDVVDALRSAEGVVLERLVEGRQVDQQFPVEPFGLHADFIGFRRFHRKVHVADLERCGRG